jgi:hypothetical protein
MKLDSVNPTIQGGTDRPLPSMLPVTQTFPRDNVGDVPAAVRAAIGKLPPMDYAGKRIAITAGSRGIPHIVEVLHTLVAHLRGLGADPFIVPAMGSHGKATAEGQVALLAGYGITENSVGAPIHASMDVVQVATLDEGIPLFCDRLAYESDGIVLCNKIQAHSAFKGEIESGLAKMMAIGLGKHQGAFNLHQAGFQAFADIMPRAGEALAKADPILFGLAMLINAHGEIALMEALPPARIVEREKELLRESKRIASKLYMPEIDVLIVDEIGKDISGAGMDPNVTGRPSSRLPGFVAPPIQRVIVRGISQVSHGNGNGIGNADFTTLACANTIDFDAMYTNAITAGVSEGAKMPLILASDRAALVVAIDMSVGVTAETAKIVRIKNTKKLFTIQASQACLPLIEACPELSAAGPASPMRFDGAGMLTD